MYRTFTGTLPQYNAYCRNSYDGKECPFQHRMHAIGPTARSQYQVPDTNVPDTPSLSSFHEGVDGQTSLIL